MISKFLDGSNVSSAAKQAMYKMYWNGSTNTAYLHTTRFNRNVAEIITRWAHTGTLQTASSSPPCSYGETLDRMGNNRVAIHEWSSTFCTFLRAGEARFFECNKNVYRKQAYSVVARIARRMVGGRYELLFYLLTARRQASEPYHICLLVDWTDTVRCCVTRVGLCHLNSWVASGWWRVPVT